MHPFRNLLLISLGRKDAFEKVPSPGDWDMLFGMASQQALLGVLFDGVARLEPAGLAPPVKLYEKWELLAGMIAGIHERHERQIGELETLLDRLGLEGCILKGTGLARLFPVPEHRTCGDIDLWIRGSHKKILRCFRDAGYHLSEILYQECKVDIFEDTTVELHFHPSKMYNPFHNARLQRCLERLSPIRKGVALSWPDARFNAVFCMAHMFRHYLEGGLGLRQMMDYYYVLQALDPADRAPVMKELRRLGMGRFTAAMMCSLQFNFGLEDEFLLCPPDRNLGRRLVEDAIRMGNFGVMDSRNRAREGEGRLGRFFRKSRRVFSYLRQYPGEVIWSPFARLGQFVWRLCNGYLHED